MKDKIGRLKNIFLFVALGIILCLIAAMLLNMFFPKTFTGEVKEGFRYVYLAPKGDEDYFVDIARGIKAADLETGSDTLLIRYNNKYEELNACIRDAVLSDVQGIIMKASKDATETMQEALEQNIPVIFYNVDFPDTTRTDYVGIDNYEAGTVMMRTLSEKLKYSGNILLSARTLGADSQEERIQACVDFVEEYPEMQIVGMIENDGNELRYKELLLNWLKGDITVDALLCLDGISGDITGDILLDQQLEGSITVAAFDLTEMTRKYVEQGIYSFVVTQDAWEIGYEAVNRLNTIQAQLEKNDLRKIQSEIVPEYLEVVCVTKDNLDQYPQTDGEELDWDVY